jgi:Uma2 family endonuclease
MYYVKPVSYELCICAPSFKLKPGLRITSDEEFWRFCITNPDLRFERTSRGEIVVVPPAGVETAYCDTVVATELSRWAKNDTRGKAFGTSEFILPNGAARSPDAAWVSQGKVAKLTKGQKRKFPPLCPEFVVEVMSSRDRLKDAKEKMVEWIENGVQLGWLIDGDRETVYIYRAGRDEPEKKTGIRKLAGEGPIAGFVLDLTEIWAGL